MIPVITIINIITSIVILTTITTSIVTIVSSTFLLQLLAQELGRSNRKVESGRISGFGGLGFRLVLGLGLWQVG